MRKLFYLILSVLAFNQLSAQNLPNVQSVSLPAPVNVKVDGKLTEWRTQLQAYNHATDVFYSIANDADNLYVVVYATKPRVIDKIIDVGITFVINIDGKKNNDAKSNISFTYPHIDVANGQRIIINAGKKVKSAIPIPIRPTDADSVYKPIPANQLDAHIKMANSLIAGSAKVITVSGISEIPDDTLSIYNQEKIRAAAAFDKDGNYTYELAVPLKYLHLQVTADIQKFNYSIRIDGRLVHPKHGIKTMYVYPNGSAQDVDQDLDATTDFWGEYTLAKK